MTVPLRISYELVFALVIIVELHFKLVDAAGPYSVINNMIKKSKVYRYLWIERVTGSSFEVGLDDLKLSGNNDQILQKKTLRG
ncbi:hypothetical protein OsI_07238 [Oryza sativa Indica Group]|uniref:Uncharacterized protein n=1 Tax=Oryza sativa subsp. indica TaxID=39946 RepID=A2X4W6_ORYSI|nr:hypothetical protein OsI_07238 [Oryza sativa Indica Group]